MAWPSALPFAMRVQSGVTTSKYSKPDKGMTTLAAFFTFDANEAGGTSCVSVDAFGPDGELYDTFFGATGKYEQSWGCTDLRPDKSTKGWRYGKSPRRAPSRSSWRAGTLTARRSSPPGS
jgi:hypothetical protein